MVSRRFAASESWGLPRCWAGARAPMTKQGRPCRAGRASLGRCGWKDSDALSAIRDYSQPTEKWVPLRSAQQADSGMGRAGEECSVAAQRVCFQALQAAQHGHGDTSVSRPSPRPSSRFLCMLSTCSKPGSRALHRAT